MIYIPNRNTTITYRKKRSTFIGTLNPATKKTDANKILQQLRKKNPKAKHFCWAYRFYGNDIFEQNYSDAGEPSGSAGRPILNILKKHKIGNCILTIIRIFGGVKLGKKGLASAYKD